MIVKLSSRYNYILPTRSPRFLCIQEEEMVLPYPWRSTQHKELWEPKMANSNQLQHTTTSLIDGHTSAGKLHRCFYAGCSYLATLSSALILTKRTTWWSYGVFCTSSCHTYLGIARISLIGSAIQWITSSRAMWNETMTWLDAYMVSSVRSFSEGWRKMWRRNCLGSLSTL